MRVKLAVLAGVVCAGVLAAPLEHSRWLYFAFSFVCHQQPERSLWVAGLPLAVCSRCAGIHLGALLGLLSNLPSRRSALLAALVLMTLDWATEAAGMRPAWLTLRFLTGALAGFAVAPVVLEGGTALLAAPYRRV